MASLRCPKFPCFKKEKNPKGPEVCDTVAHSSHQAELPFRRPIPPQSHWNQCITRPKEKPPNSVKHISFPREQKQVKNGDTHTHTQKNPGTKLAVRCTDLIIIIIKKSTKKEQPKKNIRPSHKWTPIKLRTRKEFFL